MRHYLRVFPFDPKQWPATEDDYLLRLKAGDSLPIDQLEIVLGWPCDPYYLKHFNGEDLEAIPIEQVERLGRPDKNTTLYHGKKKVEFDIFDWAQLWPMQDFGYQIRVKSKKTGHYKTVPLEDITREPSK